MKKLRRERSVRIMSAAEESTSSEVAAGAGGEAPSPADFDAYFPWVCARLHEQEATTGGAAAPPPPALAPVLVRRIVRQEKVSDKIKSAKAKKSLARLPGAGSVDADWLSPVPSDGTNVGGVTPLYIGAAYDARDRLVQVSIGGDVLEPGGSGRIAVRALAACAPHQPFLTRFTVRGDLDSCTLRDIADLLPLSTLTELRLDDSPLAHADWHTLLQEPCKLRYLSLCRCRVDDAACSNLASALRTCSSLALLDLSSNRIGDEGSRCLGALLRVDRHLCYLNLSDNRIGDVGCLALLGALGEFPLTCDEIVAERRRRLAAAREKLERRLRDAEAPPLATLEPLRAKGKPASAGAAVAAAAAGAVSARKGRPSTVGASSAGDPVAEELEPYALTQTVSRSGYVHCVGNSALVYLNLAYNELERSSVRRAIDILRQQSGATAQAAAAAAGGPGGARRRGLLRIVLEGNPLPADGSDTGGSDLSKLEDILERRLLDTGVVGDKKKGKK